MTNPRPKLLFLARPFPPLRSIGSVRTWNLARYLTRLDWDVTVVTPDPAVWKHVDERDEVAVRLRNEGIQRILTDHHWRCLAPGVLKCRNTGVNRLVGGVCRQVARRMGIDNGIGWARAVQRACAPLMPGDVDLILASGSPFAAFAAAKRLSERLGCPYVLDYRDLWTENAYSARALPGRVARKERQLLAGCAAATIVSPSWAARLDARFGVGSKLHVVTNGYDPEELAAVEPHDFGHFAIVYTGSFYPPKLAVSPVMAALRQIRATSDEEWYFHYYGRHETHVREQAARFGVGERVIVHGNVPRADALSAVRGAKVAVVITSVAGKASGSDTGVVPGKVFEALGLRTPTLLIAPPNGDAEAITQTAGFVRRFGGNDVDGIAEFFRGSMRSGAPGTTGGDSYAWTTIANRMDSLMRPLALGCFPQARASKSYFAASPGG